MDYANVYPIFYYLLQDKNLEFIKGFPADLNKLMRSGEVDISPVSSIEFARNHNQYVVHKNVCVSSIGAVKSVNIYSNYKAEDLDGKKIYFTKESNTSTVLCRIVLEKFYNIKPIYIDDESEADAKLLIGDKINPDQTKFIVPVFIVLSPVICEFFNVSENKKLFLTEYVKLLYSLLPIWTVSTLPLFKDYFNTL